MIKRKIELKFFLSFLVVIIVSITCFLSDLSLSTESNPLNDKTFNIKTSGLDLTNVTVVSDGIQGIFWNDGYSTSANIAIDSSGNIHVVWSDATGGIWGSDPEIMYASYTKANGWSIPTVISDGYDDIYWNDGWSSHPQIAIDNSGNIHVVWQDDTDGIWGSDLEILYVSYTKVEGWSNATVISDGYNDMYWNEEWSLSPDMAIDSSGNIYIVWEDGTDGIWGSDYEIMSAIYTEIDGWSNVTVISDGYDDVYWNNGWSGQPKIAIDNLDTIHVVWSDNTVGMWGSGSEILYANYTETDGWTNVTVISDGYNNTFWNDRGSLEPDLAIDNSGTIHVVWEDRTYGVWGVDEEIMYASYKKADGWSNVSVVSDGYDNIYWNDGHSMDPAIAIDSWGNIHVVWSDDTDGIWGSDSEIMYANYTEVDGWTNVTVISDGYNDMYCFDGWSLDPELAIDKLGSIYIVWSDDTDGIWGSDSEIMYVKIENQIPLNGISFGNFNFFLSFITILGLAIYLKKKIRLKNS